MINLRVGKFKLRISKTIIRAVAWIALAIAVIGALRAVGVSVTPRDERGRPVLLVPSLWATNQYRKQVQGWIVEMEEVNGRLSALLEQDVDAANSTELYLQGEEMQNVGEKAISVDQRIAFEESPVSMVGLRDQAKAAAAACLESAVLASRWLNAPSEAGRREASESLEGACLLREELVGSRWLGSSF